MAPPIWRPAADTVRRRLRSLAAERPVARRVMTSVARELEQALDDGPYRGEYFGEGRNPDDRAYLSGYERYDRDTSHAGVGAFLVWDTFPARRTLDVGCATGFVVEALRELGVDAEGVDVSGYAIEHATAGARGHVRQADLRRGLPFADGWFDVVTAFETLEHLPPTDIPAALAEIRRVTSHWALATIPSFGPNRNGPGGWFQVKVRDDRVAYYEGLGPTYEGPIPYDDLYRDARGDPIEGHLTVASFSWWEARFADAGLVRCDATERRLAPELARFGLTKYWNLYVLRTASAPEPPPALRSDADRNRVLEQFGLADATAAPDDLKAVQEALDVDRPSPPGGAEHGG
jgi:SAM-dependent methyltransferase